MSYACFSMIVYLSSIGCNNWVSTPEADTGESVNGRANVLDKRPEASVGESNLPLGSKVVPSPLSGDLRLDFAEYKMVRNVSGGNRVLWHNEASMPTGCAQRGLLGTGT
jgi:hypothetical protein